MIWNAYQSRIKMIIQTHANSERGKNRELWIFTSKKALPEFSGKKLLKSKNHFLLSNLRAYRAMNRFTLPFHERNFQISQTYERIIKEREKQAKKEKKETLEERILIKQADGYYKSIMQIEDESLQEYRKNEGLFRAMTASIYARFGSHKNKIHFLGTEGFALCRPSLQMIGEEDGIKTWQTLANALKAGKLCPTCEKKAKAQGIQLP